jgi:spermidine synthase
VKWICHGDSNGNSYPLFRYNQDMHLSADKTKLEIDITDAQEWVEQIVNTTKEICNDSDSNRIKLNRQHTGFIIEYNVARALSYVGWAIEWHLDDIPSKLK